MEIKNLRDYENKVITLLCVRREEENINKDTLMVLTGKLTFHINFTIGIEYRYIGDINLDFDIIRWIKGFDDIEEAYAYYEYLVGK